MQSHKFIRLAAILGALAVAVGAFGAHGLKSLVGAADLVTFNTGVRYHFYHTFAIFGAALLMDRADFSIRQLTRAAWCWLTGILLFSGSLYLLTLREFHGIPAAVLGPVTPVGGVFFIVGWVFLFLGAAGGGRPRPTES